MSVPSATREFVEEVVELASAGAAMAAEAFARGGVKAGRKPDGSVVTATDREVELFLRDRIAERYPRDAVLGEEHGCAGGTSGRRWIVDPIDGTEAFIHGVAEFCTLIAVEDQFGPLAGAIVVPILGETVSGGRGLGAFWCGTAISVSDRREVRGAFVATSDLDDWPDAAVARARSAGLHPRTWGGGYGIGLALTGRVDAFIDYDVDIWDVMPAFAMASEAGGRATALDGSDRADGGTLLVSNGLLHAELLGIFAEEGTRP